MPLYNYKCLNCNFELNDINRKITEDVSTYICPNCSGQMKINFKNYKSSFLLTGTGWYKTDYSPKLKSEE